MIIDMGKHIDNANKTVTTTDPHIIVNTDETKCAGLLDSSLTRLSLFIKLSDS